MKIIITGATGFIGKRLVQKIDKKNKIIAFAMNSSNVDYLKKAGIEIRYGNLLDKNSVFNSIKGGDIVIHLATSNKQGNEGGNILGTKNLIDSCKKNKVKKIIFISSMATKRKYLDGYGKTKLEIEKMIKSSGLKYVILIPTVIYSEDNLSLIGKSLKFPFIIPVIGSGKYKLNPVHIEDVTQSIVNVLNNKKAEGKEYDIAGAENISYNKIIEICKKKFKIKKRVFHIPIFLAVLLLKMIPIISTESIRGINEDTNANIEPLKRDLKINPRSFEDGIKNVYL